MPSTLPARIAAAAFLLNVAAWSGDQPVPMPAPDPALALLGEVRAFRSDDLFQTTKRAQAGDAAAAYQMGLAYKLGAGASRDATEAVNWFQVAAALKFAPAEEELFIAHTTGAGTPKDPAEGLKWLTRAAEHGRPTAQFALGVTLEQTGKSAEALDWYRRAAGHGHANAENALGFAYEKGRGVEVDAAAAVGWYRRAATRGNSNAQSNLGSMLNTGTGVTKDPVEAAKWFRSSAEQGWAAGMGNLAGLYAIGSGVPRDWVAACQWGRLAAHFAVDKSIRDQGTTLVALLEKRMKPEEIEAAKAKAEAWIAEFNRTRRATAVGVVQVVTPAPAAPSPKYLLRRKAAEAGDAAAQVEVGADHYRRGEHEEARNWFAKAAEQQNSQGEYSLGVLHLEGSGTSKDEAEAIRWFEKAASRWNLDAMNNLFVLHYRQRQTGDHLAQAYMWAVLAASAGHASSQNNLAPIKAQLTAEQVRVAEAAATAWRTAHPRP